MTQKHLPIAAGAPEQKTTEADSLLAVSCIQFTSPAFRKRLLEIAKENKVDPDWLVSIMSVESGINPGTWNDMGFVGLIQFGPDAAKDLGTTSDDLAKMSDVEQLEYVGKYIKKVKQYRKLPDGYFLEYPQDLYVATFSMGAIGNHADDEVFGWGSTKAKDPSDLYRNNKGYDDSKPPKGYFTFGDVRRRVRNRHAEAKGKRIAVDEPAKPRPTSGPCKTKVKGYGDEVALCDWETRQEAARQRARAMAAKKSGNCNGSGNCKQSRDGR